MGGTNYSDAIYAARIDSHARAGTDVFTHDADIRSGRRDKKVHEKLDPKRPNTVGKIVRESFDSDIHPTSRAVAVFFDVTGSMSIIPRQFVKKLDKLMALLVKKGYLAHPHVLFGAIGDATCDMVPLQIGQFEGGNEMDETLSLIVLEGGGGAHITESYELAMYYMARHTDIDCIKKRGEKAFLFLMGDEIPYPVVNPQQVEAVIGDHLQVPILTSALHPLAKELDFRTEGDLLKELQEKFEVFWILPGGTNHFDDARVIEPLRKMFVQNFLQLENPEDVCELIASTIGVTEGYDIKSVASSLKDVGADRDAVDRASKALVPYAASKALVKKEATVKGDLVESGTDSVSRI